LEAPACWEYPQAALTGVLPQQQPFREDVRLTVTLAWLPEEDDDETLKPCRVEDVLGGKRGEKRNIAANELVSEVISSPAAGVRRWGTFDLLALVREQAEAQDMPLARAAEKFTIVEVPSSGQGWIHDPWLGVSKQR